MKKQEKEPFLDRVLLHSKNADERLFDMVLRFITFVILIIIVWLYADLVHAKASDNGYIDVLLLGDNELSLKPYFNNDDWSTVHTHYPDTPYYTNNFSFTNEVPGHVVLTSDMDYQNNYIAIGRCYWAGASDSGAVLVLPKDIVDNNHVYLCNYGRIYSDVEINTYYVWFNKRDSENTSLYNKYDVTIPVGYSEFRNLEGLGFSSAFYWYLTNMDYFSCDSVEEMQDYLINGESEDCFNVNYLKINDLIEEPTGPLIEGDENHLYLKNYTIGLTSADNILNSNLVVHMEWDEYIEQHLNDYYVEMKYELHYHGEPWALSANDPHSVSYYGFETVPLAQFKSYYSTEFRSICKVMKLNNEMAKKMIDGLNAAGAYIYTSNGTTTFNDVLNGASAEFSVNKGLSGSINLGVLYNYLDENLDDLHAGESTIFIDAFTFGAHFTLKSKNTELVSKSGGKGWDFLNGTSDNSYGIYENQYPFEGSTLEGKSDKNGGQNYYSDNSSIAYGGNANASANGGNVGNITITTGNGYKDTELHQLTNQDIVQNHQKIITVIEDLKYCFHQFAQENNHNSFIQMIYDDYNYIPGIEYITSSIIIICGVCILIFIIKIAF